MEGILTTFGVDWRLLLINAINFGLLLAALSYFLYTPIMNMLEERRERIAKGVREAEAAEEKLQEIEHSRKEVLAEAGAKADEIVGHARAAGLEKEKELLARADAAAASLLKDAQAQAAELKAEALEESKQEVAKLIVLGMEKALHAKRS